MAGFQAVDLDSILDEFEFNQSEAEKLGKSDIAHIDIQGDNANDKPWSAPKSITNTVNIICVLRCGLS